MRSRRAASPLAPSLPAGAARSELRPSSQGPAGVDRPRVPAGRTAKRMAVVAPWSRATVPSTVPPATTEPAVSGRRCPDLLSRPCAPPATAAAAFASGLPGWANSRTRPMPAGGASSVLGIAACPAAAVVLTCGPRASARCRVSGSGCRRAGGLRGWVRVLAAVTTGADCGAWTVWQAIARRDAAEPRVREHVAVDVAQDDVLAEPLRARRSSATRPSCTATTEEFGALLFHGWRRPACRRRLPSPRRSPWPRPPPRRARGRHRAGVPRCRRPFVRRPVRRSPPSPALRSMRWPAGRP